VLCEECACLAARLEKVALERVVVDRQRRALASIAVVHVEV
jgi:hypothetical protein